ncbi:MAG: hypothetical protein LBG28_06550 [Tannerella sp.]|jgi:hypothetical protein|nr:hypothetical protein [Tannerella sp.]
MANNDRLQQIISNVQILRDLTNSMKDSEIYPVSFFSRAFDLMQKIQSDFHMLEADQVEMFAAQMKKHQALILSIHRQMRNIEGATPAGSPAAPPGSPTVKITEDPAVTTPIKISAAKRPARPIPPPPPSPPPVSETAKTTEKSTITRPVRSGENPVHKSPTEAPPLPSINEAIEKRSLSDLRRAFRLNDRFRYRRELFGEDEEIMNKVISILNEKVSYKDSLRFLDEKLHWDFSNPTVKDFIKILEMRFL